MNTSPLNRSREIFLERVVPQLGHNDEIFRKMLAKDSVPLPAGAVAYKVDGARFDRFFDALSYGIVYKACGTSLPATHRASHIYHNFVNADEAPDKRELKRHIAELYAADPMSVLDFGRINALNSTVYSAKIFGIPEFKSSITIVHEFFGVFRVSSMLSLRFGQSDS
jgi:hypothetical protein